MVSKNVNSVEYVNYGAANAYDDCIDYFRILILSELKNNGNVDVWVAGGAMRDFFQVGYVTTDIDLYFSNDYNFDKAKFWILGEKERFDRNSTTMPKD